MLPDDEIYDAVAAFCNTPAECAVHPLGDGNINDTYLVKDAGRSFVLQKINKDVFPHPERVILNFQVITAHLGSRNRRGRRLRVSEPIRTLLNTPHYRSRGGNLWRAQTYVQHASYGELQSARQAHDIGSVLAVFHNQLQDLDPEKLAETLPGFHDLRSYLSDYFSLPGPSGRVNGSDRVKYCREIINEYRDQALSLRDALEGGLLHRQIVHGDPKLDNFMFDSEGSCLGLLDLDTVGSGLVYQDIGDCLRSCCNVPGEKGAEPLTFHLDVFSQFLKGYFSVAAGGISQKVDLFIYHGVVHICFELGLRFFTDYLRGNVYFKIEGDEDNLNKAVSQFQLVEDVVRKRRDIERIVWDAAEAREVENDLKTTRKIL